MPARAENNQPSTRILRKTELDLDLLEFLVDRQARNLAPKTIRWYKQSLTTFRAFLQSHGLEHSQDIGPPTLRRFLLHLQESGHNPGGVRNIFGAVKAFLNWYAGENAPDGWRNPLRRVKTPKTPQLRMEPVSLDHLRKMLAMCKRRTFTGDRDRAIMLALLDTGCRASEFLALEIGDVDLPTGAVLVRHGKGRKFRTVFLGAKSRRALMRYLRHRPEASGSDALWVTRRRTRLTYSGLREIMRRRARKVRVATPSLHSFRRAFALLCLRNEVDLISLQRLMGHADLSVLQRYLAQTEEDLRRAHEKGGPVDHML